MHVSFLIFRFGQLGQGELAKHIPLPCEISGLCGSPVTQIACGRMHTVVLTPQNGRLYAFGAGYDGQLGNDDLADSMVPKLVQGELNFVNSAIELTVL